MSTPADYVEALRAGLVSLEESDWLVSERAMQRCDAIAHELRRDHVRLDAPQLAEAKSIFNRILAVAATRETETRQSLQRVGQSQAARAAYRRRA